MAEMMFVKPKHEIVRDPITRLPLPRDGAEVPADDRYWLRRLAQGDVVKADPPPAPEPAKPEPEAETPALLEAPAASDAEQGAVA